MLAGPKYTRIRSFASDGSPPPDVDQENVCESCMRDCSFSESTESHVALEQDQEEEEGRGEEGGEEEEGNRSNSEAVFRRRPSSLRRSISEPHLPQPVLLSQTAHGACAEDSDDESTTLCSFLPWLSALGGGRFSLRTLVKDLASFSRLATSDGATSSCASSPGGTQDGSRYTGSGRGFGDPVEDWNRSGSFINKPTRGWLHPDELVLGSGVLYNVRYMGCIEVMKSMRALDFTTRTQVTREAICQICETCASLKGIPRKRKPTQQPLCSILGNRNMQFSGFNITLTISISSLNLMMPVNKQIIANHHMQSISFASGGDQEMTDFVAYVAKDPVNHRACHILECEEGKAQDVICTIGQAFELRFKQYLGGPPRATPFSDRGTGRSWFEDDEKVDHEYYNSLPSKEAPPGGLVDLRLLEGPPHYGLGSTNEARRGSGGSQGCQPEEALLDVGRRPSGPASCAWDGSVIIRQSSLDDPMYVNTGPGVDPGCPSAQLRSGSPLRPSNERAASFSSALARDDPLLSERWFHGRVSRQQVETMLHCDGDFLVRESTSTAGQFVLTGMHGGRAKHLLLVDPKGVVRTKDREFSNVSHLITYHRTNQLPIISAGSELCLRQPVERLAFD